MRVESAGPRRRSTGLTALIDVVFLLLLFFMLASTFSRFAMIEVALGGRAAVVAPAADAVAVLVGVDGEGNLHVNGLRVGPDRLAEALRSATGGDPARILVRPSAGASVQDIVRALERAKSAAVGDVILVR
jgi:biopolymer transport protein ExbD